MRCLPLLFLFTSGLALAAEPPARCSLEEKVILSRSERGIPIVSNLGEIEATCSGPERPFPTKPGESLNGLRMRTTAFEISQDGSRKLIPSDAISTGEGRGKLGELRDGEWVDFVVHPALDVAERDAEIRNCLDNLERELKSTQSEAELKRIGAAERLAHLRTHPEEVAYFMQGQNRVGHFIVQCRIMDGEKVIATGSLEFEVIYKGRLSDSFAAKK